GSGARRGAGARAVPGRDGQAAGRNARARRGSGGGEGQESRGAWAPGAARGHRRDGRRERGDRHVKVYNTLTRSKEEFVPLTPGHVRIYACGVTVYDLSHIGHARSTMVFDVIQRYFRFKGYRVTFVRHFTDVTSRISARPIS